VNLGCPFLESEIKNLKFILYLGLAVDDIQAVQDNAILKRLAMQVELVLDVERMLPTFILRRLSAQKVCLNS
jgi:hypothetical protein